MKFNHPLANETKHTLKESWVSRPTVLTATPFSSSNVISCQMFSNTPLFDLIHFDGIFPYSVFLRCSVSPTWLGTWITWWQFYNTDAADSLDLDWEWKFCLSNKLKVCVQTSNLSVKWEPVRLATCQSHKRLTEPETQEVKLYVPVWIKQGAF